MLVLHETNLTHIARAALFLFVGNVNYYYYTVLLAQWQAVINMNFLRVWFLKMWSPAPEKSLAYGLDETSNSNIGPLLVCVTQRGVAWRG